MHKVEVNVHMLRTGVKNRIDREIGSSQVVAPKGGRPGEKHTKLKKKRLTPEEFGNNVGNTFVFGLGARASNGGLLARALRDKRIAQKNTVSTSASPIIWTACLVGI